MYVTKFWKYTETCPHRFISEVARVMMKSTFLPFRAFLESS